jgi:hypothetical protein
MQTVLSRVKKGDTHFCFLFPAASLVVSGAKIGGAYFFVFLALSRARATVLMELATKQDIHDSWDLG